MYLNWEKNLGPTDRAIRYLTGLLLPGLVIAGAIKDLWAVIAMLFAFSLLLEARFAY